MARPLLKPAIVSVERVQIDRSKFGPQPGVGSEVASPPSSADQYEEALSETPVTRSRGTKTDKEKQNMDIEFVSTFQIEESSRPSTSRESDLEIVSVEAGPRSRSGSTSSVSSGRIRPPPIKKGQKRKKALESPEANIEEDEERTHFSDTQRREVDRRLEDIELLSSADMAVRAIEWLTETERLRNKSKNIKRSFTRKMKINVGATTEIVKVLAMRASQEGDVSFLRTRIIDMQKELNDMREENQNLKLQMEELRRGANMRKSPTRSDEPRTEDLQGRVALSPDPPLGMEVDISPDTVTRRYPERGARGEPKRGTPHLSSRKPSDQMGEDFFEKLNTTISNAVVNSFRSLMTNGVLGEELRAREQNVAEQIRAREERGCGSSSMAAEPHTIETVDDGLRQKWTETTGNQRRGSRRTRGKRATAQIMDERMLTDELGNRAEYPPLPAARNGGAQLAPEIVQTPQREREVSGEMDQTRGARKIARLPRVRALRSSAITISSPEGGPTYSEIIRKARNEITLEEIGIKETRMRSTVAGGVLIEIPGENTSPAADTLARKLRDAFQETNILIKRPMLRGEIRLTGLDASVTTDELIETLAKAGECDSTNVRLGSFRIARNGQRTVWLQCPLYSAHRLAESGRLRVGWSTALVTLLRRRPLQCFKCFATGHVRDRCPSGVDRSDKCFNCGEPGHTARDCGRPPCCPICKEKGLRHDHRAGSEVCPPCPPRRDQRGSPRRTEARANRSGAETTRTE
ncbi:PREDICTED: uncharacterized protein LOC105458086 [Wasmannia auropunctata]|uniref:uncharacterized protein LOC105458086 n=1 Tax=Wasmannia auropunctata TaxID=64793 RepID=UPI0005EE3BAE|nr:PREDICTED: uncharacterized protein LOC105458086 [Wasmannia auropunctata]